MLENIHEAAIIDSVSWSHVNDLSFTHYDVIISWVYYTLLIKMSSRKLLDSGVEILIELRKNERALWDVTF